MSEDSEKNQKIRPVNGNRWQKRQSPFLAQILHSFFLFTANTSTQNIQTDPRTIWRLELSSFPEGRSDFKNTSFLAFPLSGSLPTYLSLEQFPSGQEKISPSHPCSCLRFLWQSEKCEKLTSVCIHSIFRTATFSWQFQNSALFYPDFFPIVPSALERVAYKVNLHF